MTIESNTERNDMRRFLKPARLNANVMKCIHPRRKYA